MSTYKKHTQFPITRVFIAIGVFCLGIAALIYVFNATSPTAYAQGNRGGVDLEILPDGKWVFFDSETGRITIYNNNRQVENLRYVPGHSTIISIEAATTTDPSNPPNESPITENAAPNETQINQYIKDDRFQDAIQLLEPCAHESGDCRILLAEVYYRYGRWYFDNLQMEPERRYREAINMYQKALELNNDHREARLNRDIVMHIIEARGWNLAGDSN
jgi:tetratricopeptide (TPR) repeat protein